MTDQLAGCSAHCLKIASGDYEEEEKKRNVMGMSARAKCLVLLELTQSLGDKVEDVAAKLTSEDWSADTLKRYVAVARKLESQPQLVQTILQLEFELGRDSALDGITALRSLAGLNLEETDAVFVVTWLIFSAELDFNPCAENVKTLILIRALTSISGCSAVSLCR